MYGQILEIHVDCQPEQQPKHTENEPDQQKSVAIYAKEIHAGQVRKFEIGFACRLSGWSKIPLRLSESHRALQNEYQEQGENNPEGAGQQGLQAGFNQVEAQIMTVGMTAEATCASKPWTIIPMVVTGVQDFIAAGQFRGGEQLIDPQHITRQGTLLVFLEPIYKGGLDGVTPGSSCIANAYSSNHDLIESKDTSTAKRIMLHAVDSLGLVHALILRLQACVFPFKTLVFNGH